MRSLSYIIAFAALTGAVTTAHSQFMDLRPKMKLGKVKSEGELVVTKTRPASFDAAKVSAVQQASDGDTLWIAVRMQKPLSHYASMEMYAGQPDYYELQFDVKPSDTDQTYDSCFWPITPEEAAKTEIILSISPKMVRSLTTKKGWAKDGSMQCWLRTVANEDKKPGQWKNRVALVSFSSSYRPQEVVAVSPLTANVPNGFPRWNATLGKRCEARTLSKGGAPVVCPL